MDSFTQNPRDLLVALRFFTKWDDSNAKLLSAARLVEALASVGKTATVAEANGWITALGGAAQLTLPLFLTGLSRGVLPVTLEELKAVDQERSVERLEEQLAQSHEDYAKLSEKAKNKLRVLNAEKEVLQEELTRLKDGTNTQTSSGGDGNAAVKKLQVELETAQQNYTEMTARVTARLKALTTERDALAADKATLEEKLRQSRHTTPVFNAPPAGADPEIFLRLERAESLERQAALLKSEKDALSKETAELRAINRELNAQVADLREQASSVNQAPGVGDLQKELEYVEMRRQLDRLKDEYNEYRKSQTALYTLVKEDRDRLRKDAAQNALNRSFSSPIVPQANP